MPSVSKASGILPQSRLFNVHLVASEKRCQGAWVVPVNTVELNLDARAFKMGVPVTDNPLSSTSSLWSSSCEFKPSLFVQRDASRDGAGPR